MSQLPADRRNLRIERSPVPLQRNRNKRLILIAARGRDRLGRAQRNQALKRASCCPGSLVAGVPGSSGSLAAALRTVCRSG
jgi:hypothetical protein